MSDRRSIPVTQTMKDHYKFRRIGKYKRDLSNIPNYRLSTVCVDLDRVSINSVNTTELFS